MGSFVKRFWTTASAIETDGGWGIELDGKPLRTPARGQLLVRGAALADAIAGEWASAADPVDPRTMPLTGLANAAIDHVAPDPAAFAATIARYAESDLACYRADSPSALVERQAASWDALLGWARRRYDVDFVVTAGILHVPQPAATIKRLAFEVAALDPFRLAALSPLTTIGGSLVAALAVFEGGLTVDEAWNAVSLDERWQLDQWGADAEAEATLANRRADFFAAANFLRLLDLS
jgi:chaperone required for assembly of F1-ATPase